MDICRLAIYTVFYEHNKNVTNKDKRCKFLQELGKQLCVTIILKRTENPFVYRNFNTKNGIEAMLDRHLDLREPESPAYLALRRSDKRPKIQ